ncbi:MAG: methionine--tRNA ligase, partial [Candidatus Bathyarchaeia archaeon]
MQLHLHITILHPYDHFSDLEFFLVCIGRFQPHHGYRLFSHSKPNTIHAFSRQPHFNADSLISHSFTEFLRSLPGIYTHYTDGINPQSSPNQKTTFLLQDTYKQKHNTKGVSPLARKVLITAALPYANAKLHIGHLRSTYIPSDIYARYMRLKGRDVVYVCATDEHGTPIAVMAEREGTTPKEVVDKYHTSIQNDLRRMGCSFDIFGRTTLPIHYELTQEFFQRLLERGYIYKSEYEQLYCPSCQRFLPDRYVEGTCPYCGTEGARGDSCEACGRYLKPIELIDPYCITCKTAPETRTTTHWFFQLSAFQSFIKDWIVSNEELPANVRNYAIQWLREGLRDWCITRDLDWGVPVPLKEAGEKVIYVWFDAPIGYISSTIEWAKPSQKPEAWKEYWQGEDCEIVHFIGKDIIYHHSIFWPAMLKAHGDYGLPTAVIAGEYLTLVGRKMSKSRGWVVGVEKYLASFEPDPLRYYLTAVAPLHRDADFSWEEYARKNNDELADILGNFIHRSLSFTHRYFDRRVPRPGDMDEDDKEVLEAIEEVHHTVGEAIEGYELHTAMRTILHLASHGNRYLNKKQPWKTL